MLVRIIFMAESGQTSDFMPDVFSISAFTTDEGSRIGTFSRLDTLVGGVGNPLTMNPSELTIPVFDVFYWPPEVTSPTEFYFDTRPFIISNLDAYDCEVQP